MEDLRRLVEVREHDGVALGVEGVARADVVGERRLLEGRDDVGDALVGEVARAGEERTVMPTSSGSCSR
ncbi:hypothetical protein [Mobilicoccus pelagius]|uniref:hypothetical protein n=1 Tax=Mobilicoccus pelagius TaxID=746032 RepID=UPI00145D0C4E